MLTAALALAGPLPLESQQAASRPATVILFGGAAIPTSTTRDYVEIGYQLGAGLELRTPLSWLAVRVDGGYQRYAVKGIEVGTVLRDGHTRTLLGTGSVVVRTPAILGPVRPYLLAGAGVYALRERMQLTNTGSGVVTHIESDNVRQPGVHAGAGLSFAAGPVAVFAEARYQNITKVLYPARVVPLTVGVRF